MATHSAVVSTTAFTWVTNDANDAIQLHKSPARVKITMTHIVGPDKQSKILLSESEERKTF